MAMAVNAPKGWQQEVHDAIVHQDARCDGVQGALLVREDTAVSTSDSSRPMWPMHGTHYVNAVMGTFCRARGCAAEMLLQQYLTSAALQLQVMKAPDTTSVCTCVPSALLEPGS